VTAADCRRGSGAHCSTAMGALSVAGQGEWGNAFNLIGT